MSNRNTIELAQELENAYPRSYDRANIESRLELYESALHAIERGGHYNVGSVSCRFSKMTWLFIILSDSC